MLNKIVMVPILSKLNLQVGRKTCKQIIEIIPGKGKLCRGLLGWSEGFCEKVTFVQTRMTGMNLTLTSPGSLGSLFASPLISPPRTVKVSFPHPHTPPKKQGGGC
jgi:hypothetical protein